MQTQTSMWDQKIGVLGGGQLGKMLAQAASRWNLNLLLTDKDFDFPAAKVTSQFVVGDFTDYDLVYQVGKHVDILTIEIENVNSTALKKLENEGKLIYPQPSVIETIKDKGLQKSFYTEHDLPTSKFALYGNANDIRQAVSDGKLSLPFVQKARREGYDGRGVHITKSTEDLAGLLDVPSVVEDLVEIEKELAIIAARNPSGEIRTFPIVEMVFHPTANLVEELRCPVDLSQEQSLEIQHLGKHIIETFDMVGILAIELFLTKTGELLINESAPRPHNSGHHTIESCVTSQYEQLLRAILDLPLGSTESKSPSVMINLLGEPGFEGNPSYEGLSDCLALENVHVHIYGKSQTKPYRKMGHVTIVDSSLEQAVLKAKKVRSTLKVKSR